MNRDIKVNITVTCLERQGSVEKSWCGGGGQHRGAIGGRGGKEEN